MENLVSALYFAKNTTFEGILDDPFYSLQVFYIDDKSSRAGGRRGGEEIVHNKSKKKRDR